MERETLVGPANIFFLTRASKIQPDWPDRTGYPLPDALAWLRRFETVLPITWTKMTSHCEISIATE